MVANGHTNGDYRRFLASKSQAGEQAGFEPLWLPDYLIGFQRALTGWSIVRGRAALIEDCGLGKTIQELVYAENVVRHTNRPALIITPLAVAQQTVREGEKFGIECRVSRDGRIASKIVVTNYERLHYFNPDDFACAVGDEASAIKAFDGKRRKQVTRFLSKMKYRLLATATAAPNDFIELGTLSEALGELTQSDMLGTFFRSSDNMRHSLFKEGDFWNRAKWFFRPHAELPFWRWVCSWARAIRKPSDLGAEFDDPRFILPALNVRQHVVESRFRYPGELFVRIAATLKEQRVERKHTMRERCERVAELVDHDRPAVVWCQYNEEGDILEEMIPDAVQVAGCNTDDEKEERLIAFASGEIRVLVTKPKIGAWGLNWQHCGHQVFFPSHSWESWYQAIHRSLRFGRVDPVDVDVVTTEGEEGVTANLQKKQRKADEMFSALVAEMHRGAGIGVSDNHVNRIEVPSWL
jgi:hypothetical protein